VRSELPLLILITDWQIPRAALIQALDSALSLGPEIGLQHRHAGATDRTFLDEGEQVAELCRRSGNPLFVNGRLDVAMLLDAHLHLPARGMRVSDVRPHLPKGRWISAAVHDSKEAREAGGADLALLSPVFPPGSKVTDARTPLGPDGFTRLAKELACPVFALGGIGPANASQIRAASGFAAISSVLKARDPKSAAKALVTAARQNRMSPV
jgi:thiamine-phosphate pyrophosphorylase